LHFFGVYTFVYQDRFFVGFGGGLQLCGPLFNACPYLAPFPLGGFEEGRSASDR